MDSRAQRRPVRLHLSTAPPPNNLPGTLTSFVGRAAQVSELCVLLGHARLVTLTGMGGIGKTRLALEVAGELLGRYPGGTWLVELAELSEPAQVPRAVAAVLGVRPRAGRDLVDALVHHLSSSDTLLLLDNCEHLADACAGLATTLLRACPVLTILATGRERLHLAGEVVRQVPPLPPTGADGAPGLFADRAGAVQPSFSAAEHRDAIDGICRRLEGVPLAIELAAARTAALSPEEIEGRLDDRLGLLDTGPRDAPRRQRTLRATLDWSHELLGEAERTLFRRLSVFAGGLTLPAAEAVCGGDGTSGGNLLLVVAGLVDRSLLIAEPRADGTRYRLLQPVREYAAARLEAAGEAPAFRDRHRDFFVRWALEEAEDALQGPEQARWLDRIEQERENVHEAFAWCRARGDLVQGLRLAGALWRFWYLRGHLAEGRGYLEQALEAPAGGPSADRARALRGAGVIARLQGDLARSRHLHEEALAIAEHLGDTRAQATSLINLGVLARAEGELERSLDLFSRSLAVYRRLRDRRGVATCLNNTSWLLAHGGGDLDLALDHCRESLAIYREIGFTEGEAASLGNLGTVAFRQGRLAAARSAWLDSLSTYRRLGYPEGVAEMLEQLAILGGREHRDEEAVTLLGAGETLRELVGAPLDVAEEAHEVARTAAALRQRMPAEAFARSWARGQAMSLDEAVDRALRDPRAEGEEAQSAPGPAPVRLTDRELQVVRLVAAGFRDREIAERLGISTRTIEKHVEHVRDKLDLQSRAQLGAWLARAGLLTES